MKLVSVETKTGEIREEIMTIKSQAEEDTMTEEVEVDIMEEEVNVMTETTGGEITTVTATEDTMTTDQIKPKTGETKTTGMTVDIKEEAVETMSNRTTTIKELLVILLTIDQELSKPPTLQ